MSQGSSLSVRADEARARMTSSAKPKQSPVPSPRSPPKPKDPRNPRDFSFFSAKKAMDVHDQLRDLRNQSYWHGALALGALPLMGAAVYYGYAVLTIPMGLYAGWHWAQHKDRLEKFEARSLRPALTPDMMLLYDNGKGVPFEGPYNMLDYKPPFGKVFKF